MSRNYVQFMPHSLDPATFFPGSLALKGGKERNQGHKVADLLWQLKW